MALRVGEKGSETRKNVKQCNALLHWIMIYNDFQNDIADPSASAFAHQNYKEEFHLELSRGERGDFICLILSYLPFLISQCSPHGELTPCTFCLCHLLVMAAQKSRSHILQCGVF